MDYSSSWVDTSLDLSTNAKRRRVYNEARRGALIEELRHVNAENKKLAEMLTVACENYNVAHKQFMEYINQKQKSRNCNLNCNNNDHNSVGSMVGNSESSCADDDQSVKQVREERSEAKISRVYLTTEASDTSLILKDGYQWRKYGQKVTRDNPSPRAYFKCSFAPSCPVKKKVQRSAEDQTVLVATYEGEHNHPLPSQLDATPSSPSVPSRINSSEPSITLHLSRSNDNPMNFSPATVGKLLAEQMAS